MIPLIMPCLRLVFEVLLLVVLLKAGIRELSTLAIGLIVGRLFLSFSSRLHQIPDFLDESKQLEAGVVICIAKIALEVGIFFALKEDINISMDFITIILILMILRNISDTWSLLAIGLEES